MKRAAILAEVEKKLKTIRTANGFNTDVGNRVFYWHDLDFEYGEVGAIAFKDPIEQMEFVNLSYQQLLLLEVSAIIFTQNPFTDGDLLLEDLINCLKDEIWEGHAMRTILSKNTKTIETKGRMAIKVTLEAKVIYRE